MDGNATKRRKVSHGNGGPNVASVLPSVDAMGLAVSSPFAMKTEELLSENRVDNKKAFPGLDDTLRHFKDRIEAIPEHEPIPLVDLTPKFEKTHGIRIPYPDPRPSNTNTLKLAFEKPAGVNVVGSYTLQTQCKTQPVLSVDMIVTIPSLYFQVKDYQDFRYFYRRAYYLACITADLRESQKSSWDFVYDYLHGNPLLPILVARPKKSNGSGSKTSSDPSVKLPYEIRIIPTAPEGRFPVAKLSADRNSIRHEQSEDDAKGAQRSSPFYNSTLKAEALFSSYLRLLHKTTSTCPGFRDACILGRIWLSQRGFGGAIHDGGFGHFEWAALIALLLQSGGRKGEPILSPSLRSTQLFKATLQFLADTNLNRKPVVVGKGVPPEPEAIRQRGPVLYDAARSINILFKMSPWSAYMLQEQAKCSLSSMNTNSDYFESLFITKVYQPLQMYDLLAKVNLRTAKEGLSFTDCRGFAWNFGDQLYQILSRALGERARLIHVETPTTAAWSVSRASPRTTQESLVVGIIVDPQKASQGRDFGPSYEEKKEATEFRAFWGDKADLWQFPSGDIVESLDWTQFTALGYHGICEAIIRYILNFKLKVTDDDIVFPGNEQSRIISLKTSDKAAFDEARKAFETLEQEIRGLEGLPLHIRQIAPASPLLRRASLRAPDFSSRKQQSLPMDAVISFEASGSWPENIAAIQRAKVAFLLKIGESLEQSNEEIKTYIGREEEARDVENLAFLDVVYEDGASFRLRVHSDLEQTLLERKSNDRTIERNDRLEAVDLLAKVKRVDSVLPLHNQTILTSCTRFPAFSDAMRLVKFWFNSHKLSSHFSEDLVEVFVLHAFLQPYPWETPSSATTGFLRTLMFLSRWNWHEEPLIVDSSVSLSYSQRVAIQARFDKWRQIDPNMNRVVLFVATSHDVSGSAYTPDGPSVVVANRMRSLAQAACKLVKEKSIDLDIRALFHSDLEDYDVVIHLSSKAIKALRRDDGTKHSHFKNLDGIGDALPIVRDPIEVLLNRFKAMYESPLLFFSGGPEDYTITALWNPQVHKRTFTANLPCSFMPVGGGVAKTVASGEGLFDVNRDAILAEIARIGGDLIEKIEKKR
ncbi:Nrap protein [Xylariomycetidae sp. FL2044]|nr:Nrap protein [Xylariomycetidae sp. FL2044]